jgi:indole-3-glycerol phosphate synthase
VSESGIATPADACRAALAGARALLVGETLVRTSPENLPALIGSLKDPGWPA